MSSYPFSVLNADVDAPSPTSASFTLTPTSHSPTDIWRKPIRPYQGESINSFNAPIIYKRLGLPSFQRARVTVSAPWSKLYDQGGLIFILPSACAAEDGGNGGSRLEVGKGGKWIKTGIEFYEGEAYVSTVACDRWSDWSLVQNGIVTLATGEKQVTLEMERKDDDDTLWIYVLHQDGDGGEEKRIPVREVTWALSEGEKMDGVEKMMREVWVGVYAATPTAEDGRTLEVKFTGFELVVMRPEQMARRAGAGA
jgi:regulation of enolase protein 1 (concanavalin A-like superfamily)